MVIMFCFVVSYFAEGVHFPHLFSSMAKEGSPLITKRTTRSASSAPTPDNNNLAGTETSVDICSPSLSNLVYGDPIKLDSLLSTFPGRQDQIRQLFQLLGPLNSPILPFFVYGSPSTGKTSVVLQLFRHFNRPFIYSSFRTCYNPRILFESILNQLLLHSKNAANGYSSAKRCDRPSDFVNFLCEALAGMIKSLKENGEKAKSHKSAQRINGHMIYLIFDHLELVREWDKASTILPLLFNLYDILKIPEVGIIFISSSSPDMFYSSRSSVEPLPLYFPSYDEVELRQILLKKQANWKLYSSFLDAVLSPCCRITRRVDELSSVLASLYIQYCSPLSDPAIVPTEDLKRSLYSNLKPHISSALNEICRISSLSSPEAEASQKPELRSIKRKLASPEQSNELDIHMSTSAKYLLVSAFLASRNPATLDASLFDSTGGLDGRKRRRKSSDKTRAQHEAAEDESLTKGPGSFPLERLLAIFQCLTSVAEGSPDEESGPDDWISIGGENHSIVTSDVLLQISSLCNANFLVKGRTCPLEGSTRYRCMVSEDFAHKVTLPAINKEHIRWQGV